MMNKTLQHHLRLLTSRFFAEKHRFYHTLDHVEQVVGFLYRNKGSVSDAELVAAYFHDIVYVPGSPYNEEQSVYMLHRYVEMPIGIAPNVKLFPLRDVGQEVIDLASTMILDSAHLGKCSEESEWFIDADLSILAATRTLYEQYVRNIRKEYAHATDEEWQEGREAFLSMMLNRPSIFHRAGQQHTDQARLNMAEELISLRQVRGDVVTH